VRAVAKLLDYPVLEGEPRYRAGVSEFREFLHERAADASVRYFALAAPGLACFYFYVGFTDKRAVFMADPGYYYCHYLNGKDADGKFIFSEKKGPIGDVSFKGIRQRDKVIALLRQWVVDDTTVLPKHINVRKPAVTAESTRARAGTFEIKKYPYGAAANDALDRLNQQFNTRFALNSADAVYLMQDARSAVLAFLTNSMVRLYTARRRFPGQPMSRSVSDAGIFTHWDSKTREAAIKDAMLKARATAISETARARAGVFAVDAYDSVEGAKALGQITRALEVAVNDKEVYIGRQPVDRRVAFVTNNGRNAAALYILKKEAYDFIGYTPHGVDKDWNKRWVAGMEELPRATPVRESDRSRAGTFAVQAYDAQSEQAQKVLRDLTPMLLIAESDTTFLVYRAGKGVTRVAFIGRMNGISAYVGSFKKGKAMFVTASVFNVYPNGEISQVLLQRYKLNSELEGVARLRDEKAGEAEMKAEALKYLRSGVVESRA